MLHLYAIYVITLTANLCRYERQLAYINQEMESECVEMQEDAPEEFTDDCCGRSAVINVYTLHLKSYRVQKCIWDLMEHPESSSTANIVSFISMMFVIVSTIGMALNTMPGLKVVTSVLHDFDNFKIIF